MVRTQGLKAVAIVLLAAAMTSGCSPNPPDSCSGQGLRDVDSTVETLIKAAHEDSVNQVCPLLNVPQEQKYVAELLDELRTTINNHGGFDSLEFKEIDQLGAEHVIALRGADGRTIGRISVVENSRRFFLTPIFNSRE